MAPSLVPMSHGKGFNSLKDVQYHAFGQVSWSLIFTKQEKLNLAHIDHFFVFLHLKMSKTTKSIFSVNVLVD